MCDPSTSLAETLLPPTPRTLAPRDPDSVVTESLAAFPVALAAGAPFRFPVWHPAWPRLACVAAANTEKRIRHQTAPHPPDSESLRNPAPSRPESPQ